MGRLPCFCQAPSFPFHVPFHVHLHRSSSEHLTWCVTFSMRDSSPRNLFECSHRLLHAWIRCRLLSDRWSPLPVLPCRCRSGHVGSHFGSWPASDMTCPLCLKELPALVRELAVRKSELAVMNHALAAFHDRAGRLQWIWQVARLWLLLMPCQYCNWIPLLIQQKSHGSNQWAEVQQLKDWACLSHPPLVSLVNHGFSQISGGAIWIGNNPYPTTWIFESACNCTARASCLKVRVAKPHWAIPFAKP